MASVGVIQLAGTQIEMPGVLDNIAVAALAGISQLMTGPGVIAPT